MHIFKGHAEERYPGGIVVRYQKGTIFAPTEAHGSQNLVTKNEVVITISVTGRVTVEGETSITKREENSGAVSDNVNSVRTHAHTQAVPPPARMF